MARKSIFDIAAQSIDMESEIKRIIVMSFKEKVVQYAYDCTLVDFVDKYCFKDWKYRGHFVNLNDMLDSIGFDEMKYDAMEDDVDSFMRVIETIYNLWRLARQKIKGKENSTYWIGNFYHLKDVMDDNLEKYNHKAYIDDERILIIEDKPEVTAAAEIVEYPLAIDIIRYNHRSMQGEVEAKKQVLLALGAELEPKRKELVRVDKQLSEDIFYMLNNLNLRHNNRSKKDKNYKEYVAKMPKKRLEKWYDELYQMILLALLMLDHKNNRESTVKELKEKVNEVSKND